MSDSGRESYPYAGYNDESLRYHIQSMKMELERRSASPAPPAGGEALDSPMKPFHTFPSGARRSELKPRYDLIPAGPLRRLAARYAMGAERYGEYNWQKGLPMSDTLNHVIDHLQRWNERQNSVSKGDVDDDLAAAAWGCFALMWLEDQRRTSAAAETHRSERMEGRPYTPHNIGGVTLDRGRRVDPVQPSCGGGGGGFGNPVDSDTEGGNR